MILDKLIEDGFVKTKNVEVINVPDDGKPESDTHLGYYISFKGNAFCETGGYTQQNINENQERERIRVLETYPDILNRRTLWLVYATFALAVVELAKWFYDNHWFPFCGH